MFKKKYLAVAGLMALAVVISGCGKKKEKEEPKKETNQVVQEEEEPEEVEEEPEVNQPKQGKVTVKELAKQNAGMVNIEITNKNIKSFERYARKYGINYALKKDKSKEEILKDTGCTVGVKE